MTHIAFSVASGFLRLRHMLQGLAHSMLALRNLRITSSRHLIPTLSAPPLVQLMESPGPPLPPLGLSDDFRIPFPTTDLLVIDQPPPFMLSPMPSYQSSLAVITPSNIPDLLSLFIMLAIIFGLFCFLPELAYIFTIISKSLSAFVNASNCLFNPPKRKPTSNIALTASPSQPISFRTLVSIVSLVLLWTGPVSS
jgi:hypothetical protein